MIIDQSMKTAGTVLRNGPGCILVVVLYVAGGSLSSPLSLPPSAFWHTNLQHSTLLENPYLHKRADLTAVARRQPATRITRPASHVRDFEPSTCTGPHYCGPQEEVSAVRVS